MQIARIIWCWGIMWLGFGQLMGQNCNLGKYKEAMGKALVFEAEGDFDAAYAQYNAAKVFCFDSLRIIQDKQDALFVLINRLRFLADSLRKESERKGEASRILNKALTTNDQSTKMRLLEYAKELSPENEAITTTFQNTLSSQEPYGSILIEDNFTDVAMSPDGNYILSSTGNGAKLWDANSGDLIKSLSNGLSSTTKVAFSPAGGSIAIASNVKGSHLTIWDLDNWKLTKQLSNRPLWSLSIAFSPDGKYILVFENSHSLKLWNVKTGEEILHFTEMPETFFKENAINCVTFSPDGKFILAGTTDGKLISLPLKKGTPWSTISKQKSAISSAIFSPDGKYILTASMDTLLRLWELESGEELRQFKGHISEISSICFSPNGKYIASCARMPDLTVKLWDVESGKILKSFNNDWGHQKVFFSPDNKYLYSTTETTGIYSKVKKWEIDSPSNVQELSRDLVNCISFSPDKTKLLMSSDGKAKLWDIAEGKELTSIPCGIGDFSPIAFVPDMEGFMVGGRTESRLIALNTGELLQNYESSNHSKNIFIQFFPDGSKVILCYADRTADIYEVSSGKSIDRIRSKSLLNPPLAISKKGDRILSVSELATVNMWELTPDHKFNGRVNLKGHRDKITALGFSPDDLHVLTGSRDKTAILWDLEGNIIRRFVGHQGGIMSVELSPDGKYLLTGGKDNKAILWNLDGTIFRVFHLNHACRKASFSADGTEILLAYWPKYRVPPKNKAMNAYLKKVPFPKEPYPYLTESQKLYYRMREWRGE